MNITGLQKLSLVDYPGKLCATVFFGGCNFRCPFCHNSSLVLDSEAWGLIGEQELITFLDKRRGLLDGVCVSGGEPLLHDIAPLLEKIKALGFLIKLDTNGAFPDRLIRIIEAGLIDYVAMDVKNSPALYEKTTGVPGLDLAPVMRSVEYLKSSPVQSEFRTTLVRGLHTPQSIRETGEWLRGAQSWYLQTYVDSGAVLNPDGLSAFSEQETAELLKAARESVPITQLRG